MDKPEERDSVSAYHDLRHTYDLRRSVVWQEICRYLQKYIPSNSAILDLGAGYGDFLRHIKASQKYGLEQQETLLPYWPEGVQTMLQSALDPWMLDDGILDFVFASNFFEHFQTDDSKSILTEVWRVLQPKGTLIVIQPNMRLQPGRYFEDFTHKTPFTEVSFGDFLQSLGWRIRRCERRFLPFTMKSNLPKWSWLVRVYLLLPFRPFAGQFLVIAEKAKDV